MLMLRPDEPLKQVAPAPPVSRDGATSGELRDELIDWLARRISGRGMEDAAIFFLEMHKPLSFIAGQGLLVASPFIAPFIGIDRLEQVSELLAERENLERLIRRLEELRQEREEEARCRRNKAPGWWPFRRRSSPDEVEEA